MKFNLNDSSLVGGGSTVFNKGIAGKTDKVKIEVTKRRSDEPESNPLYKLVFTDSTGAQVNQGFFPQKDNENYSKEKNEANANYFLGRILSAAKAVVPEGFEFPDVEGKSVNEIADILFSIIKSHSDGVLVNVFTTYGTKEKPSKYLGLRFFDFIERADNTGYSRLTPKGNDMMERLVEDAPKSNNDSGDAPKADNPWGNL